MKFVFFLKSRLLFNISYVFLTYPMFVYVCKQTFHIFWVHITQKVNAVIMQKLRHNFHVKTKVSLDFQICISVPLMIHENELTLFNRTESSHK